MTTFSGTGVGVGSGERISASEPATVALSAELPAEPDCVETEDAETAEATGISGTYSPSIRIMTVSELIPPDLGPIWQ